jgi:hypothetical protein
MSAAYEAPGSPADKLATGKTLRTISVNIRNGSILFGMYCQFLPLKDPVILKGISPIIWLYIIGAIHCTCF